VLGKEVFVLAVALTQKRQGQNIALPLLFEKMMPPVLKHGCSSQMAILVDMDDG
jgi:hypothetical protein